MRRLSALLLATLAAGCAYPSLEQRQAALAPFVGADEATLVRALGVPARSYDSGGHRFLAYVERRADVLPSGPGIGAFGAWGPWGFGPPQPIIEYVCETTFEVDAGRVRGFSLRGNLCG